MNDKRRHKILIVDDDSSSTMTIREALEPHGCDVRVIEDPEDSVLEGSVFRPDIIFISLELKGSNGLKVSKAVHSSEGLRAVPIIMMISYKGELDPKYTMTLGVVDVIVKPLSDRNIVASAFKILGEKPAAAGLSAHSAVPNEFHDEPEELDDGDNRYPGRDKLPAENENNFALEEDEIDEYFRETELRDKIKSEIQEKAENNFDAENNPGDDKFGDEHRTGQPGDEAAQEFSPEPARGTSKKTVVAGALAVLLAGVAAGAFFAWKTLYTAPAVQPRAAAIKVGPAAETLKQEAAGEEKPAETKTGETLPAPPEKEAVKPETTPEKAEVKKPQPAEKPKTVEVPVSDVKQAAEKKSPELKKTAGTGGAQIFSAQAGVFSSEKNAQLLVVRLAKGGFEAFIMKDGVGAGTRHRVLIGKFGDRSRAMEEVGRLKKEGFESIPFLH